MTGAVIGDDGAIGGSDQPVDERGWRLAADQVLPYRGERNLRNQELCEAYFLRPIMVEDHPRAAQGTGPHPFCHLGDACAQFFRPFALHEILSVVQQQQARCIQMRARPGRRVERGLQPVTGIERRGDTLSEVKDRPQPQRAEQYIARGEAMVERPRRRTEALGNRRDGDRSRPTLGGNRHRGGEKVRLAEPWAAHWSRISILDQTVNTC